MLNTTWQMMLVALAGWVNEQQLAVIEYLKEENRVLREQLGHRRLRFTGTRGVMLTNVSFMRHRHSSQLKSTLGQEERMTEAERFVSQRFPRSSEYHPEWITAGVSGGANALWLTEWLAEELKPCSGMRVLDLGCGLAMSSIFLRREFGVQVWATDLWFSASENLQRVRDAGVEDGVFPIHADARSLPFATEFFDAVVSIDSFVYYGTDDQYLY